MATINRIRAARINPLIARDYERDGTSAKADFPFWLRPEPARPDPYTRRANICPVCHLARALGSGECAC